MKTMIVKDMLFKSAFSDSDTVLKTVSLFFTSYSKAYHIIFNLYIDHDFIGTISKFEDNEPIMEMFDGFNKLTNVRKAYVEALFDNVKTIFEKERFINAYNKIF